MITVEKIKGLIKQRDTQTTDPRIIKAFNLTVDILKESKNYDRDDYQESFEEIYDILNNAIEE